MNSKEALERLKEETQPNAYTLNHNDEDFNTIKQDLDRLEKLEKENTKLKNIIKLLEDNLKLVLYQDIDPLLNRKVYAVGISKNYKIYSGFEVTQEQYELIEEYKKNE